MSLARAAHDLVVDSVTGVDVSLTIAGTGARSLAFLIDLLIRGGLAAGWFVIATLAYNGEWSLAAPPDPSVAWFLAIASAGRSHLSPVPLRAGDPDARANTGETHARRTPGYTERLAALCRRMRRAKRVSARGLLPLSCTESDW